MLLGVVDLIIRTFVLQFVPCRRFRAFVDFLLLKQMSSGNIPLDGTGRVLAWSSILKRYSSFARRRPEQGRQAGQAAFRFCCDLRAIWRLRAHQWFCEKARKDGKWNCGRTNSPRCGRKLDWTARAGSEPGGHGLCWQS